MAGARAEYAAGLALPQRLEAADPTNADVRVLAAALASRLATCCGPRGGPRGGKRGR